MLFRSIFVMFEDRTDGAPDLRHVRNLRGNIGLEKQPRAPSGTSSPSNIPGRTLRIFVMFEPSPNHRAHRIEPGAFRIFGMFEVPTDHAPDLRHVRNLRTHPFGHRSSVIGHRSSVIGHRSSVIGHRPSVIGHRPSTPLGTQSAKDTDETFWPLPPVQNVRNPSDSPSPSSD